MSLPCQASPRLPSYLCISTGAYPTPSLPEDVLGAGLCTAPGLGLLRPAEVDGFTSAQPGRDSASTWRPSWLSQAQMPCSLCSRHRGVPDHSWIPWTVTPPTPSLSPPPRLEHLSPLLSLSDPPLFSRSQPRAASLVVALPTR